MWLSHDLVYSLSAGHSQTIDYGPWTIDRHITFFPCPFAFNEELLIIALSNQRSSMGKGDKKSKKGKIWRDSYGNSRKKKALKAKLKRTASKKTAPAASTAEVAAKPKRTSPKKKSEA